MGYSVGAEEIGGGRSWRWRRRGYEDNRGGRHHVCEGEEGVQGKWYILQGERSKGQIFERRSILEEWNL